MPHYNVCYKDKWACYSSVADDFITDFMPESSYELWRSFVYGNAKRPIQENCIPIEEAMLGMCIENPANAIEKAERLRIDRDIVEAALKRLREAQP